MHREAFSLSKLMDVAELVQEEPFVQWGAIVKEHRTPECNAGHVRRAEDPAADSQRNASRAKAGLAKLREPGRQLFG